MDKIINYLKANPIVFAVVILVAAFFLWKLFTIFSCVSAYGVSFSEVVKSQIYGADKKVYFTIDEDYTHVIIINTAMPAIPSHIPKENVIGLAYEPLIYLNLTQNFVNYAEKNISRYYIGDKLDLPNTFVEHYGYMWHVTPLQHIPEKNKKMSIMVSQKMHTFGHKYRHVLVQNILKHELPIDIYGRGCFKYSMFHSPYIRGNFENLEPYENYDFHIAIENVQSNHYFSEKIVNPPFLEAGDASNSAFDTLPSLLASVLSK